LDIRMVDISEKPPAWREAVAWGRIRLKPSTIQLIREGRVEKGDVEAVARLAAIMAVKKTPEIVPLCHPIPITWVGVDVETGSSHVDITVTVRTTARTGVEMEALTGVAAALLAVWDMVKKYEKDEAGQYPYTLIEGIRVLRKIKEEKARNGSNSA
jgi:cyclic pyranopterin phosphate synthase